MTAMALVGVACSPSVAWASVVAMQAAMACWPGRALNPGVALTIFSKAAKEWSANLSELKGNCPERKKGSPDARCGRDVQTRHHAFQEPDWRIRCVRLYYCRSTA